jgi:hypothetical protein
MDDMHIREALWADEEPKLWLTVPELLDAEECATLRQHLDAVFDETKPGNNGRVVTDLYDRELTQQLWTKIAPHVPTSFGGRTLVGPHSMTRIMRYEEHGQL